MCPVSLLPQGTTFKRPSPNAGFMLGQRRRRWPNMKPALGERPVIWPTLNQHWVNVSCLLQGRGTQAVSDLKWIIATWLTLIKMGWHTRKTGELDPVLSAWTSFSFFNDAKRNVGVRQHSFSLTTPSRRDRRRRCHNVYLRRCIKCNMRGLCCRSWSSIPGMTGPPNSFTARVPVTLTAILFTQPAV